MRADWPTDCLSGGPLDRPRRPGVPFKPSPLPVMIDGEGPMGSARDRAPDPSRAGSPVLPPRSARPHLRPVSALAPLAASTPGRIPPESCQDLTTGRECSADSVYNAERIAQASLPAWESRANCSSRPCADALPKIGRYRETI
jgi:hypothetical protein